MLRRRPPSAPRTAAVGTTGSMWRELCETGGHEAPREEGQAVETGALLAVVSQCQNVPIEGLDGLENAAVIRQRGIL